VNDQIHTSATLIPRK